MNKAEDAVVSGSRGDPALLGLPAGPWLDQAVDFNFHPARYLHNSWIEHLPHSELWGHLHAAGSELGALSRLLIESLELDRAFCQDFSAPLARLALVEGEDLECLYLYLGVAMRADEIRLQLRGERIRALKEELGEAVYDFALHRADALGELPEFIFEPEVWDLRLRYQLIGAAWCERQLACPPGVEQRYRLKLPAPWAQLTAPARSPARGPGAEVEFPPFIQHIAREVIPRWQPLFD